MNADRPPLGSDPMPPHLQRRRRSDLEPSAGVTKEDLWHLEETLGDMVRDGFQGVHKRQDETNGRVTSAHLQLAEQGTKIKNLEREIFVRRRRGKGGDSEAPALSPVTVTMRDVKMTAAGVAACGGVVVFVWKVLPLLKALLQIV